MRTISELLTILRDNAEVEDNIIQNGLCLEVQSLWYKSIITDSERCELRIYIKENMPVHIIKLEIDHHVVSHYGWPKGEWPPRLAWLNEHIELNKQKEQ